MTVEVNLLSITAIAFASFLVGYGSCRLVDFIRSKLP
jgi:hypothetical protein